MDFINDIDLFGEQVNPGAKKKAQRKGRKTQTPEEKMHDKVKSLLQVWDHLPNPGTSQHLITDGTFDFYSFVGAALEMQMTGFDEFHGTTWLMNQPISTDLINQYDQGRIRNVQLVVGRYLKARTPNVYGFLKNAARERNRINIKEGRIHAKVILLGNYDTSTFLTIQGSANFTENPRTEQYVITNSADIYEFHKEWIDEFRW